MHESEVWCPVCGGETILYQEPTIDGATYFRSVAYGIAGGDYHYRLPIWKCESCGHGATEFAVSAGEIMAWYKRHELDTVFLADEAGRRRTAAQVLRRIEQLRGGKGALLDIGAGPGLFVSEARRRGWQAEGVEPSDSSRTFARGRLDIFLRAGGVEELGGLASAAYDVVTMFDVIEHLPFPVAALREVRRLLVPGGVVVIVAPKFDSLLARLLGTHWYSIFPAHLHYFTNRSLTHALAAAGFESVARRRHVRHLGIGYIAQRLRKWIVSSSDRHRTVKSRLGRLIIPVANGDEFEVYARAKWPVRVLPGRRQQTDR